MTSPAPLAREIAAMPTSGLGEERIERVCEVAGQHADDVDRHGRFPIEAVTAMREARLLSAILPSELGGDDLSTRDVTALCTRIGAACASSGMIFAMHVIQLASIHRHARGDASVVAYLRRVAEEQRLIGSVTSEVGSGGDLRCSQTHVVVEPGAGFTVEKQATASSYCEQADDLLLTARSGPEAAGGDQVAVLLLRGEFTLDDVGEWDTLGMRGTCSPAARVTGRGEEWQILPAPFREIAARTMVPISHIAWAGVWLGLASDASHRARRFLQKKSRKDPDGCVAAQSRLASLSTRLGALRAELDRAIEDYDAATTPSTRDVLAINDLKLDLSEGIVDIVTEAIRVIGIAAYRNTGEFSLGRHLRDAHSAALMISNDRIRATNADLLMIYKGD